MTAEYATAVAGPLLTLLGVVISAWGTYETFRQFHSFKIWGFFAAAVRVFYLKFTGRSNIASKEASWAQEWAKLNPEEKQQEVDTFMVGIYIIFIGFVFQGMGAVFWAVNAIFYTK